jgi:uncharacterized phage protein (TIGR02216 family)
MGDGPAVSLPPEPDRWAGALALALRLGLPPEAFWRLSLKEWRALTAPPAHARFGRGDLGSLMARFPDTGPGAHVAAADELKDESR